VNGASDLAVGVIANCRKPRAADVLQRLRGKAQRLGLKLVVDAPAAALMGVEGTTKLGECLEEVRAVIALGGDGTLLRTVRELAGRDIPVLGVNIGGLGFLTSVAEEDLERALDCLVSGTYTTSWRTMLECTVHRSGGVVGSYRALNDVVLTSFSSRVVTLRMLVNDEEVGDFVCDGLIVATPTGSTGHSLSVGGPVLMPATRAFLVSLISPHTLSTRPLVLPDDATVRVQVAASSGPTQLTADGQVGQPLQQGDSVAVWRSARGVRFMHLPGHSYFAVLRQKLHWRGSNV